MKIALAQTNPTIGDIKKNTATILNFIKKAAAQNAEIIIFPELALCGYPPKDLLLYPVFIKKMNSAIEKITQESEKMTICIIIGAAIKDGKKFKNSAIVIENGKISARIHKQLLPSYDVFDEPRYFTPGGPQAPVMIKNKRVGICICEDAWSDDYNIDPIEDLHQAGAELIINLSASPYEIKKESIRFTVFQKQARKTKTPLVMVNQSGANDELLFDGRSLVFNHQGDLIHQSPSFKEDLSICDMESSPCKELIVTSDIQNVHDALVMGIKDYTKKSGFKQALIGLSGGIDSAVTAALAVTALGAENVFGITMPSQYSSQGSIDDSVELAINTGMQIDTLEIKNIFDTFEKGLSTLSLGKGPDVTEENLQARIRGTLLMAVSNKMGRLLLTTGNKSEMAIGYCTLYGDMNGGLAVIADLYKTMVYNLALYINRNKNIIPTSTITKPPSAELRQDQKDEDSLPPYDVLDAILEKFIEDKKGTSQIIQEGFDYDIVEWVAHQVQINEYKRFQAAPVLKITPTAFGTSRRMPITSRERL